MSYLLSEWDVGAATARVETRDDIPTEDPSLLHLILSPPLAHDPDSYDVSVWADHIADCVRAFDPVPRGIKQHLIPPCTLG
jgi:hypothetical protein